jgi:hypothetical protein
MRFGYGRADARMNRLPDRQIDVDDAPSLSRIRRPRNGHVETLTARMGGDEAKLLQKLLQVAGKAWSIDDDVQAAVALRSCRNGVAFPLSHCREKTEHVKGQRKTVSPPGGTPPDANGAMTPQQSFISPPVTRRHGKCPDPRKCETGESPRQRGVSFFGPEVGDPAPHIREKNHHKVRRNEEGAVRTRRRRASLTR